jgi:hypothetical protein
MVALEFSFSIGVLAYLDSTWRAFKAEARFYSAHIRSHLANAWDSKLGYICLGHSEVIRCLCAFFIPFIIIIHGITFLPTDPFCHEPCTLKKVYRCSIELLSLERTTSPLLTFRDTRLFRNPVGLEDALTCSKTTTFSPRNHRSGPEACYHTTITHVLLSRLFQTALLILSLCFDTQTHHVLSSKPLVWHSPLHTYSSYGSPKKGFSFFFHTPGVCTHCVCTLCWLFMGM